MAFRLLRSLAETHGSWLSALTAHVPKLNLNEYFPLLRCFEIVFETGLL